MRGFVGHAQNADMDKGQRARLLRLQVVAISVVGAIAVLCFVASLLLDGAISGTLSTVALVAAGVCAVIGVTFAFVGGDKR